MGIANAKPDRHFEALVPFVLGSLAMEDNSEEILQTMAATYCMRKKLRLQLVGCPDRLENDALQKKRTVAVQEWLENSGVQHENICISTSTRAAAGDPGVVCE